MVTPANRIVGLLSTIIMLFKVDIDEIGDLSRRFSKRLAVNKNITA